MANNKLTIIPNDFEGMHSLVCLQLHNNKLNYLPRGIVELEMLEELSLRYAKTFQSFFKKFRSTFKFTFVIRGNPLINRFVRELAYSPPSLLELAGRAVINNKQSFERAPREIISRLQSAKCCPNPACGGVYFDLQYKQVTQYAVLLYYKEVGYIFETIAKSNRALPRLIYALNHMCCFT